MNAKLIGYGIAILAVVAAIFGSGYYLARLEGQKDVAALQSQWDKERSQLASDRADAITAQQTAERGQADAINTAAQNYAKGKADAEQASKQVVDDLRTGNLRLRNRWASCGASSAEVPASSGGHGADAGADDREESAGRIVRAAAQCDAQVIGLQQALMGERAH